MSSATQLRPRAFDPRLLPGLALFIDPASTGGMTRTPAAALRRSSSQYLSTPDHADFSFPANEFTVEFWQNSFSIGFDRAYIGQYAYNTTASWNVSSGDGVNGGNSIKVFLAINPAGNALVSGVTPQATLQTPPSQVVVRYRGAGASNAERLKVAIDGVDQTLSFSGTIPTTLQASTANLEIGRFAGLAGREIDAALSRMRIWNIALADADVTTLWNSGRGRFHAELGALNNASLVASWDLTESSGTRADSKNAHHFTENNGPINATEIVTELVDRSRLGLLFQGAFGTALHREPAGLNGLACLASYGRQFLQANLADWSNTGSGDILEVIRLDASTAANYDHGMLSTSDVAVSTRYFFSQVFQNATNQLLPSVRMKNDAVVNDFVTAGTPLVLATPYLTNWRGLASGGAASYQLRLNGAAQSLTYSTGGMQNRWVDSVVARDVVTLGAFYASAPQGMSIHKMGPKLVFGPGLPTALNRQVEQWLARRYGIALS